MSRFEFLFKEQLQKQIDEMKTDMAIFQEWVFNIVISKLTHRECQELCVLEEMIKRKHGRTEEFDE
jgi:hypothetical protein